MARRDVRRHRGRSALIVVMVGLPVLLLTGGSTLWFTDNLNPIEQLPFEVGRTQALVTAPQQYQVRQMADPTGEEGWPNGVEPPLAVPLPGLRDGHEQEALEALLGADLFGLTSGAATVEVDGHFSTARVLWADLSRPERLSPRVILETGRWPRTADEVVVTAQGVEHGLPASGTMTMTPQDPEHEPAGRVVTIVGTGRAFEAQGARYLAQSDLMTVLDPTVSPAYDAYRQWLVDRPQPLTWSEIESLNTYGVKAYSRHVVLHPETVTRRPEGATPEDDVALLVVGAASLGLLLLTTLLAGPAFAVSAARQRRTLALAASNGATTAQLRRSVLGQALVLGVLSGLVGAGSGVGLGIVGTLAIRTLRPDLMFGPLEIPWPAVALVTAAAVLSSLVAALIPSRGLGRLDIVTVLRGQAVSARLRRRVPAGGAVLTVAGAAAVTWTTFQEGGWVFAVFLGGCVSLVVGALMVVPLVLSVAARVADRLPLPLRMAAREAGRQRGRATPTVAAVMAGAAVLAVVAVGQQADTVRQARDHSQRVLPGQGVVQWGVARPAQGLGESLRQAEPDVSTVTLHRLSDHDSSTRTTMLVAQRPGCTLEQTTRVDFGSQQAEDTRCVTAGTDGPITGSSLAAASLSDLDQFIGLTRGQRTALEAGALAILDPEVAAGLPKSDPFSGPARTIARQRPVDVDVHDGSVTFASYVDKRGEGDMPIAPSTADVTLVDLPVVLLSHGQWMRLVADWNGGPSGLVTTDTAVRLGATLRPYSILVRTPDGITPEQESRLNDVLRSTSADTFVTVERGFQRDDALMLAIVFGVVGLVILVATLIATALAQAENTPLLGTLAAVGATRATRRALAAAQAAYLGLLGSALGLAVGLVPGVAIARLLTTTYSEDGLRIPPASVDVPWLQLVLPLLAVPLVAGLLAWVSIRRAPTVTVTRRAT